MSVYRVVGSFFIIFIYLIFKMVYNDILKFEMNKTKEVIKQSLNQKLDNVKSILTSIFASLNQRDDVSSSIGQQNSKAVIKKNQTLYPKRQQVEKQNKILLYEVNLLFNLLTNLSISKTDDIFTLSEQNFNNIIAMSESNEKLQNKIGIYEQKMSQIDKQKEQLSRKIQNLQKNLKIGTKKVGEFQKIGGIGKYNELKDKIKQLEAKINELNAQNQISKQQIKKLNSKCKILQELNKQTQNKMAEIMVENRINNIQNENKNGEQFKSKGTNNKIELLAAKQQIRNLKGKIESLERQKEIQRVKYSQKQSIYEKLMMKNLRN